jgi:hypothetical protein
MDLENLYPSQFTFEKYRKNESFIARTSSTPFQNQLQGLQSA